MRLLVLGGTSFVGRALAAHALERGHELTLFSRGRTGADLFPDVPRRIGDRDTGDYASLAGGGWDAVVDVSGYVPRHVREAADAVAEPGRYLFISTGSVYDRSQAEAPMTEDAARLAPEHGTEQVTPETYGPLKVACEDEVRSCFGERATVVRPGVVAGPHDPTDRFTWWVRRAARGGRLALAGRPDQPVQVVDVHDLAHLVVALLEADAAGTYDAVGPAEPTTLAGMVRTCAAAAGTEVELVPVDPTAVDPPLPLVLLDPADDVLFRRSAAPARAAGLTSTPLEQTAREVLSWDRERGERSRWPRAPAGRAPATSPRTAAPLPRDHRADGARAGEHGVQQGGRSAVVAAPHQAQDVPQQPLLHDQLVELLTDDPHDWSSPRGARAALRAGGTRREEYADGAQA